MTRTATRPSSHAVSVERTIEATGSTIRLVIEPLPGREVLIKEYRRRRKPGGRFERLRGEEGKRVPFDLLNLELPYEVFFPQGGLFEEPPKQLPKPTRRRRSR